MPFSLPFSSTALNNPAKSRLEVKGATTLGLAAAAAKFFKGLSLFSYSSVRPVTERCSKSKMENTLC